MNNESFHRGITHTFTNQGRGNTVITIQPGQNETLNIIGNCTGSTATAGELVIRADLDYIDTSLDTQSYFYSNTGQLAALHNNFWITQRFDTCMVYDRSGSNWVYETSVNPVLSTGGSYLEHIDIFDNGSIPLIVASRSFPYSEVAFCQRFLGTWVNATYSGTYANLTNQVISLSLTDRTCYLICQSDKNIYKISVDPNTNIVQRYTSVNFPSFPYPQEIKASGNRIVVSYIGDIIIRVFDENLAYLQGIQNFDPGFSKSITISGSYLAVASDKTIRIYSNVGFANYLPANNGVMDYQINPDTINSIALDKKDGKYIVVHSDQNAQYFLVRKQVTNEWIQQTMTNLERKMSFLSTYPTVINTSAYGDMYMTGAQSIETVFIKPLIMYTGSNQVVASITLDPLDYSADILSLNEINFNVNSSNKLVIDSDSLDFYEKIQFKDAANTKEVAIQNERVNEVGIAIDTIEKLTISETKLTASVPLIIPQGTAPNCGLQFPNDPNTGIYQTVSDSMSLATSGVPIMTINTSAITANKPISMVQSSASFPTYSFQSNSNTGVFQGTTNRVQISAAGTEVVNIGSVFSQFNNTVLINENHISMSRTANTTTGPVPIDSAGVHILRGGCPNSSTYGNVIRLPNIPGTHVLLSLCTGASDVLTCQALVYLHVNSSNSITRQNIHLTGAFDNLNTTFDGTNHFIGVRDYNAGTSYGKYNLCCWVGIPS
jgi:hypothetical protein